MYRRRVRASLVAVALSLALALGACNDDGGTTTTAGAPGTTVIDDAEPSEATTTTEAGVEIAVTYRNGEVEGGVRRETVEVGETVRLVVTSDVDEEIHVHTYDVTEAVPAGGSATVEFVAHIPGVHEVELHESGKKLLTLEVRG